jgi:hypothetical protein
LARFCTSKMWSRYASEGKKTIELIKKYYVDFKSNL